MKALTGILAMLAFVATAHAEDLTKIDTTSMESKATEQAAPAAAPVIGMVARSAVTSGVENREPIDGLTSVTTETGKIYYFTELRDMEGQKVMHRWEHNGEVMAEVPFEIGGSRWRVFSSKKLAPTWTGDWKVSVIDAAGGTLSVNTFTYTQAVGPSDMSGATSKEMPAGADNEQKSETPNSQ